MIYHLLDALKNLDLPGQGLFQYLSFRAIISFTASLLISIFAGKRIIGWLQSKQIGETIRDLGLEGQIVLIALVHLGGDKQFLNGDTHVSLLPDIRFFCINNSMKQLCNL